MNLQRKVDIAVLETGLGGRLDSTNVVIPEISVITTISLDHCHILGDTLEEIAGEKGGIIKEGVPVVTGWLVESANDVVQNCLEKKAPFFTLAQESAEKGLPITNLNGDHQRRNAAYEGNPNSFSRNFPLILKRWLWDLTKLN